MDSRGKLLVSRALKLLDDCKLEDKANVHRNIDNNTLFVNIENTGNDTIISTDTSNLFNNTKSNDESTEISNIEIMSEKHAEEIGQKEKQNEKYDPTIDKNTWTIEQTDRLTRIKVTRV